MVDGPFGGMVDGGPILVPGTRLAKGRLWDEHLRHLGYPPKFYRVQDAISGNNSPFLYHFRVVLVENHKNICFFSKSNIKKKKNPARKPTNSRPEWGCTPDGRFFKIRELANQKLV